MKYYSEITKKMYENEQACSEAEKKFTDEQNRIAEEKSKKMELRKTKAKEIEDAHKATEEARKHERELINEFVKEFGSYHYTVSTVEDYVDNLFEDFFRFW